MQDQTAIYHNKQYSNPNLQQQSKYSLQQSTQLINPEKNETQIFTENQWNNANQKGGQQTLFLQSILSNSRIVQNTIEQIQPQTLHQYQEQDYNKAHIEDLTKLLHQRDQEIVDLKNRPFEKIIEVHEVTDHAEIEKLKEIISQMQQEILSLRKQLEHQKQANKQTAFGFQEIDRLTQILHSRDQQLYEQNIMINELLNKSKEKEVLIQTQRACKHKEISELRKILDQKDQEILDLINQPKEKEIVVQPQVVKVIDYTEIERLSQLLRQKEQELLQLKTQNPKEKQIIVEKQEVRVIDNREVNRLNQLLLQKNQEILYLQDQPREKEIVYQPYEVKVNDYTEIDRLTNLLREKEQQLLTLSEKPIIQKLVEIQERQVLDKDEVQRLSQRLQEKDNEIAELQSLNTARASQLEMYENQIPKKFLGSQILKKDTMYLDEEAMDQAIEGQNNVQNQQDKENERLQMINKKELKRLSEIIHEKDRKIQELQNQIAENQITIKTHKCDEDRLLRKSTDEINRLNNELIKFQRNSQTLIIEQTEINRLKKLLMEKDFQLSGKNTKIELQSKEIQTLLGQLEEKIQKLNY